MRREYTWSLVLVLVFCSLLHSGPVVPGHLAGLWYPSNPSELRKELERFLNSSPRVSETLKKEELLALISPHAGMRFCGWTATCGYKLLKGKRFDTVVVMGPSHHYSYPYVATVRSGYFETPLGKVPVDGETVEKLLKDPFVKEEKRPFFPEHSIEIELPYLQYFLGRFKVVPLLFGTRSLVVAERIGVLLSKVLRDKKALVVASSDLSHYHSEREAFYLDRATLNFIKDMDSRGLFDCAVSGRCEACGLSPILAVLTYSKALGVKRGVVLSYSTSSMATGDTSRVVGYGSVGFFREGMGFSVDLGFTDEDGITLRRIARNAIEGAFRGKLYEPKNPPGKLREKSYGVFVTLRRRGFLRGCIGRIYGGKPLYLAVRDMAVQAAFHDPRFRPLEEHETIDLDIEISVLTQPSETKPESVVVGRDGLIVEKDGVMGLLLPQVPVEYGWGRKEFLRRTCLKAGLSPGCWKEKGVKLFSFRAQVF